MKNRLDVTSSGGTKILADVLNTLDDAMTKEVLTKLEERNPELSKSIKKLLFIFEDIADFDKQTMARILREVDFHVLAVAMKTASEKLKNAVLTSLSKRAAESVSEEIKFMPPVRLKEVEAAQEQIIEVIRNLESSGEITLNRKGGGGDDLV